MTAPYQDPALPIETRVSDLLDRMTMEEKVGQLLHGTATTDGPFGVLGIGSGYDTERVTKHINGAGITSMISRLSLPPSELAAQNNRLQEIAAQSRLGIPLTISTDPRNHLSSVTGAGVDQRPLAGQCAAVLSTSAG